MKLALEKAREPEVIVLNGDTYTDVDLQGLMCRFDSSGSDLAIAVTHLNNGARYGALVIDENSNIITGFGEKQNSAAGYVNAGIYCLRRDIFVKYSTPAKFSFERDFLPEHLMALRPLALKGVRALIDIGVPEDYAIAETLVPTLAGKIAGDLPSVVLEMDESELLFPLESLTRRQRPRPLTMQGQALTSEVYISARQLIALELVLVLELGTWLQLLSSLY